MVFNVNQMLIAKVNTIPSTKVAACVWAKESYRKYEIEEKINTPYVKTVLFMFGLYERI